MSPGTQLGRHDDLDHDRALENIKDQGIESERQQMHRFSSTSKKYFSHRGRILEADLLCTSLPRGQECKQSVGVK